MVSLPGSYPLDDSAPATPEEPVTHRHQSHQNRNKLHKPSDPRSHQQSDSGVAGFGLNEADSSKAHDPSGDEYLDATGGDYYTHEPIKPSYVVESENIHHAPPQDTDRGIQQGSLPRETRSNEQPRILETDKPSSSKPNEGSAKYADKSESAPYWGDLPKGQQGGIYNTVTGHGSPKDDHEHHHHIPERSPARERSHIPGPVGAVTDKATSRVYNTVAGHGSRDQEGRGHITPPSRAASGAATVSSTEAVHDAPLVGIPEEKPFNSGLSSTAIPSSDLGMGFLPETAAQDDAKLLARHEERVRPHDDSRTGPSVAWATEISGPKTTQPSHSAAEPKSDTMHQRAFPLGPSNMLSGEDAMKSRSTGPHDTNLAAADTSAPSKDEETIRHPEDVPKSSPGDHRGRDAMLAGAGVAGTGIAAYELADVREGNKESRRSISEDRHGRKRLSKVEKKHKDVSSSSGSDYSNHKDKHSPEGRRSREEGSPKTEKMSHKILGIFGLNKDDKAPHDAPATEPGKETSPSRHSPLGRHKDEKGMPDTSTTEPPKDKSPPREKSPRHSGDKKKEAAVGAAAGAGAAGLMTRKKDAEKTKHYQEPTEASRHHEHPKQSKDAKQTSFKPDQRPVSQGFAQPATKTSGPMGSTAQGPIGPEQQPPAPTGQFGTDNTVPNFSQPNPTDRSKAVPVASGLGAAVVGAGAYQTARKHEEPAHSQPTAAQPRSAPHAFENPRASPTHNITDSHGQTTGMGSRVAWTPSQKHPLVTNKPGEYNTLSSGTASGVATDALPHQPSTTQGHGREISSKYDSHDFGTASGAKSEHTQGPITQKPGGYNSLHSGTASGIKTHHEPEGSATQKSSDHRTLHSGAAAGVAAATAIGAGAYAQKETESPRRRSTGAYNKLASGTPSGVIIESRRHRASEDQGHRSKDYKPFPTGSSSNQMHKPRGSGSDAGSRNSQQSYQLPPPPIPVSSVGTRSTGEQGTKTNENDQANKRSSGPGFISVPITSHPTRHDQHQQQHPKPENTAATDTADRVRNMSPEVMPSAYTTSTPRTGNMSHNALYGDASTADQVRHMSPEVMPSAYTTSAPRSAHLPDSTDLESAGQGPTAHSHSTDVDPALAAATGAWASSGGPSVVGGSGWPAMYRGPGGKTILHTCEHCGKENDITAYVASHQAI